MDNDGKAAALKQLIDDMIAQNTAMAPTQPGLYRMPCGECYVDFFISANGKENWLVPGDPFEYTRETVAIARHGEHPWERMYTLKEAAREIALLAQAKGLSPTGLLAELLSTTREFGRES